MKREDALKIVNETTIEMVPDDGKPTEYCPYCHSLKVNVHTKDCLYVAAMRSL